MEARTAIEEALAVLDAAEHHVALATIHEGGAPQVAVVGVAASDGLERLVFDTLATSRKLPNIVRDGRVAVVVWHGAKTVQIEGRARVASGGELAEVKRLYFGTFADGPVRESWPGITYGVIEPTWIRLSDFSGAEPRVVVIRGTAG